MPPSPDSCIACNRAFPANNELASLPNGKRIAFDPELNRVWRICTKCGEWNLLGAEAARVTSSELLARIGGATMVDATPTAGLLRVGGIDLLRLDSASKALANENQHARSAVVRRRTTQMVVGILAMTVLAIGVLWFMRASPVEPGRSRWGSLPLVLPSVWAAMLIGAAFRAKRLTGRYGRPRILFAGLLLIAAFALNPITPRLFASIGISTLFMVGFHVVTERHLPVGRIRISSGGKRWVTKRMLDETRVMWDDVGAISLRLTDGTPIVGSDAIAMLRDLLDGWSWETADPDLTQAVEIASGADPLPRILGLLKPALDASPSGLMISALPGAYRAALDLALSTRTGVTGKLSAMLHRSDDAQHVAAIAESLDRGE